MKLNQKGFTLIELMVSLVLGLIVVGAGTMLFLSAQKNLALQNAASNIQNNANFGMGYLTKNIRISNLNTGNTVLNQNTPEGGIVFGQANNIKVSQSQSAQSLSNIVNMKSDQLTIRYKPKEDGVDCSGKNIKKSELNQYVVERYFVAEDDKVNQDEAGKHVLSLKCQAGRQQVGQSINWQDKGGQTPKQTASNSIIQGVDYFTVRLIVVDSTGKLAEFPISEYTKANAPASNIVGMNLGLIVRSLQPLGTDTGKIFNLFGKEFNLKDNISTNYMREAISQTVALRNTSED